MSKIRTQESYSSLDKIIEALSSGKYPELVWVGKNYHLGQLIEDLIKIQEKINEHT